MPGETTPWFRDLPLDWTRDETRRVRKALEAAYDNNFALIALAKDAGVAVSGLNQMAPPQHLVREILEKARVADRLEALIVEVFGNDEVHAVHEVLRETVAGWEAEIQARALARKRPSIGLMARLQPDVAVRGKRGPESVLNAMADFADPAVFRQKLAACELRVAQVYVRGGASGTGFLVGDRYLLTNWHVVKELEGCPGSEGEAVFDHKRAPDGRVVQKGRAVPFADAWRVAWSDVAEDAVEMSVSGPPDGLLDYALVELAEPVGAEGIGAQRDGEARGRFKLRAKARAYHADEPLLVLGHPYSSPLMLSYASPANANVTPSGTRVRYQTNTAPGSSGSPVMDAAFEVVALHHGGADDANQGIPIARIAADLAAKLAGTPALAALELG